MVKLMKQRELWKKETVDEEKFNAESFGAIVWRWPDICGCHLNIEICNNPGGQS